MVNSLEKRQEWEIHQPQLPVDKRHFSSHHMASSPSPQNGITQSPCMPVIKRVDIRANTNLCGTYVSLRNRIFPQYTLILLVRKCHNILISWQQDSLLLEKCQNEQTDSHCWNGNGAPLGCRALMQCITCASLRGSLVATALVYILFIQTWSGRGRLHRRVHPWVQCEPDKHLYLPLNTGTVRF